MKTLFQVNLKHSQLLFQELGSGIMYDQWVDHSYSGPTHVSRQAGTFTWAWQPSIGQVVIDFHFPTFVDESVQREIDEAYAAYVSSVGLLP